MLLLLYRLRKNLNHDYTILRQVFDMTRDGGDDWVEDRFYEGKKIEYVGR